MLKRRIEERIKEWIYHGKNALLVSGARQVGKTYIIRECLNNENADFLEINLINQYELIGVLNKSNNVDDLIFNLSVATGYTFKPGKSIVFIDEVQECKDIVTKVKFWVDDGRIKFVLSGSLLGIELNNLRSAPVGYLDELEMYPLDFPEFLLASGISQDILEKVKDKLLNAEPLLDETHQILLKHFKRYLLVGGMPAAVQEYISSGDVNRVTDIQKNIIEQYKRDFTKYESIDKKLFLEDIYNLIPSELLKQNRRFMYSDLGKGLKFGRLENSFLWHNAAGVVISVYNSSEPKIPLKINKQRNLFKLYYSDVGLLTSTYDNNTRLQLLSDEGAVNCGGIYENAVIQQLNTHGLTPYYYNSKKLGELDIVIEYKGKILPIEVKSGKDYYQHSAISNVTGNKEFGINRSIVLSNYNYSADGDIEYYPIYMCAFIEDSTELPKLNPLSTIELSK